MPYKQPSVASAALGPERAAGGKNHVIQGVKFDFTFLKPPSTAQNEQENVVKHLYSDSAQLKNIDLN